MTTHAPSCADRPRGGEHGQGALEYTGIVVIAALLVGALLYGTGWGQPVADTVSAKLCEITGGSDCGSAEDLPGGPTPEEQATSGDYVALGDSYSSGEGAEDYVEGTDSDEATKQAIDDFGGGWLWPGDPHNNICRRSNNAYSNGVYQAFDFEGDFVFGACSGAITDDYYEDNSGGNEGEGPQREHLDENTSLVTISMGGNDFGFGDVVGGCVTGSCATEEGAAEADEKIRDEAEQLVQLYQDLQEDAPNARILIVGYPQLFPDPEDITNGGDSFISPEEQEWLNERGRVANQAIQDAIAESGTDVEYVDVTEALQGHEVGTDDPWIHDLDVGVDGGDWTKPVSRNSFHPKAAGQEAISRIVQQHVRTGG